MHRTDSFKTQANEQQTNASQRFGRSVFMWSIEPIGRREHSAPLRISLRGTLAGTFAELTHEDRSDFIEDLFQSSDPDIISYVEDGSLVVGRLSERGRFFPDW